MLPLASIARIVPPWAWLGLAVLAWGGCQRHNATRAESKLQQAQQRAAEERARTHELREQAMHGALVETTRRLKDQQEAATHAQRLHEAARAAAAAGADAERLFGDAAAGLAARACAGDPAASGVSPADQLANALRASTAQYRALALTADDAIARGIECERRYDALTQTGDRP